jgi:hypothetical protein
MRHFLSLILLLTSIHLWAQPANNDCSGLIDLGVAPFCDENVYSNFEATPFDIEFENEPNCFAENPPQNDVWFSFTTNSEDEDYVVTVDGFDMGALSSISNIQAAVYRGDCQVNSMAVFQCGLGSVDSEVLSFQVTGLTPDVTYFLRVDNFGGDENEGYFKICVETDKNEVSIADGSSDACSGILYDSGGQDGNYGNDENHVFTICPQEFHQCVNFNLEYYNIQSTYQTFEIGDYITFYDGDDTNAPMILQLGTDNQNLFDSGGGGICLTVQATDCLTIQFTSDDAINFEGFKGFWECSVEPCKPYERIEVGDQPSIAEIESILSVAEGSVTLDKITCPDGSYAVFNQGDDTDLGIKQGILLTSGNAENAVGPNIFGDAATAHYAAGDADLDIISILAGEENPSLDACVIEVDVVALSNTLSFEYVFASEEYPEFINTEWNDIFALLISGPGIIGEALLNNQKNMAILPGTELPVTINNVNNLNNWEFYRNNQNGQSLEYDGIVADKFGVKKSLTAITQVEQCSTYHLKFAISDRTDALWDSGVFISEINTGAPSMSFNLSSGVDYLTETCSIENNFLEIRLSEAITDTFFINVGDNTFEVSGTAELGTDYNLTLPDSIMFLPGETLIQIPISAIPDLDIEGNETIIFTITNTQCGDLKVATVQSYIADQIDVNIDAMDTINVCRGDELSLKASGGNTYIWEPSEFVTEPTSDSTGVSTDTSRWYFITASLEGNQDPNCVGVDSVYVHVDETSIKINTLDTTSFCQGESIGISIETNGDLETLLWNITDGIADTTALTTIIIPSFPSPDGIDYIVTISDGKCSTSDTLTLVVEAFDFPSFFHVDTTICQGESVQLAEEIFGTTTSYNWTPAEYLNSAFISGAIATPDESTTYELIAMSPSGECQNTAEVAIEVIPNFVNISPMEDTILLCLGDSILLTSTSSSDGVGIEWSPADVLSATDEVSVWAKPDVTTMVYITLTGDICSDIDSVLIRVDSLPELAVEAVPMREKYCMGEIVTLISPGYDEDLYPYIEHFWSPPLGVQTDLEELNLAFSAVDTTFYVRRTINGACMSDDSILINVVVPNLMLNLADTTVCPGEPVDVLLTAPQLLENIMWSPGDPSVISCSDCPDPTMTANQTTTYSVSADADGCPAAASMTVTIAAGFAIGFDVDPGLKVGLGSDANITAIINPNPGVNTVYTWTINGATVEGQNGISITVPILEEVNEVTVSFMDEFGCTHFASVIIEGVPPKFVFPNAFTPGTSPDLNDNFIPWFSTLQQWEINNFFIYNRWGQKVFDCQDKECFEMGWDGTYKDNEALSGVYMYVFNYTLPNGESVTAKGDLTLIR